MIHRAIRWAATGLADLGVLLSIAAAVLILADILGRLIFNRPLAGTSELVGLCLLLVTYLQAPKAVYSDRLLRVTTVVEMLPKRFISILGTLANLIGAGVFVCLAYVSLDSIMQAYSTREFFGTDAFRVRAWPFRFAVSILWLFLAALFVYRAFYSYNDEASHG